MIITATWVVIVVVIAIMIVMVIGMVIVEENAARVALVHK